MKEEISTEQAILKAAETEFIEKGFNMSKTTEIAKAAGVTHAMLHYYFRTKENLFDKVFQEKVKLFAKTFTSIIDGELPFLDKIKKGVEAHFDLITENPKLPFFVLSEILANKERKDTCRKIFLPIIKETTKQLKHSIDAEIVKGTIRPISPFNLMMTVISLNVFAFVAHPITQMIAEENNENYQTLLEERKQENVKTVLSRLRP